MGTEVIFSLLGPRRGLSRLFSLLLVLAAVLVGTDAQAAVPMCSEDGRTIAAPPTGTAFRGLVLEAPAPCPKLSPLATRSLPAEPGAPAATAAASPLRAVPVAFTGVASPSRTRLVVTDDAPPLPSGAARSIERPPRA